MRHDLTDRPCAGSMDLHGGTCCGEENGRRQERQQGAPQRAAPDVVDREGSVAEASGGVGACAFTERFQSDQLGDFITVLHFSLERAHALESQQLLCIFLGDLDEVFSQSRLRIFNFPALVVWWYQSDVIG
jgi:hypothetical protein